MRAPRRYYVVVTSSWDVNDWQGDAPQVVAGPFRYHAAALKHAESCQFTDKTAKVLSHTACKRMGLPIPHAPPVGNDEASERAHTETLLNALDETWGI